LKKIYEGDRKVLLKNLEVLRARLEGLKMKKEEKILDYLLRFNDIVNQIKGYGQELKEDVIVLKFLSSMTTKYDSTISSIKEGR
jgi:hypothetical protein